MSTSVPRLEEKLRTGSCSSADATWSAMVRRSAAAAPSAVVVSAAVRAPSNAAATVLELIEPIAMLPTVITTWLM